MCTKFHILTVLGAVFPHFCIDKCEIWHGGVRSPWYISWLSVQCVVLVRAPLQCTCLNVFPHFPLLHSIPTFSLPQFLSPVILTALFTLAFLPLSHFSTRIFSESPHHCEQLVPHCPVNKLVRPRDDLSASQTQHSQSANCLVCKSSSLVWFC